MPNVVLYTTSEVAKRFHVDNSAVRRWIADGLIRPTIKTPGGHYRFNEAAIQEMMANTDAVASA